MNLRGQNRDARWLGAAAAGATMILLLAACTTAPPAAFANLSTAQVEKMDQTCEQTLGAHHGDGYFEACCSTLAGKLQQQDERRRLAQAHADCAKAGLQAGSPEIARCVLRDQAARTTTAAQAADPPASRTLKSLTSVSQAEVHRTELSCANLGFDPTTIAFSDSVADLEASLSAMDSPSTEEVALTARRKLPWVLYAKPA